MPGGGVALVQAGKTAFDKLDLVGDEATGANIVKVALDAPLRQIAVNAGLEGGVVVEKVRNLEAGLRPERRDRRVRRPAGRGHHRPGQGHPLGAAERRVDRRAVPHHRGRRGRQAREEPGSGRCPGRRRHGLLSPASTNRKGGSPRRPALLPCTPLIRHAPDRARPHPCPPAPVPARTRARPHPCPPAPVPARTRARPHPCSPAQRHDQTRLQASRGVPSRGDPRIPEKRGGDLGLGTAIRRARWRSSRAGIWKTGAAIAFDLRRRGRNGRTRELTWDGCALPRSPGTRPVGSRRSAGSPIFGGCVTSSSTCWSSAAASPAPAPRWTRPPADSGGPGRGPRSCRRHVQPVQQADPRRPAVPGAARVASGARGADRAGPAVHPARAAPGPPGPDPGAAAAPATRSPGSGTRGYYGLGVAAYDVFAGIFGTGPGHAAAPAPDPGRRPPRLPQPARRRGHRGDPLLRRPGRRRPTGGQPGAHRGQPRARPW